VLWWDYLECQLRYEDARHLIDGAPPPADARLHVLRARALSGLKHMDQAIAEYDAALRLSPEDPNIRLEWRRSRGRSRVERTQWHEAAAEFAAAVELRPDDAYLWRFLAIAQVAAGDQQAYRQTCSAMLERFAQTDEPLAAANVILACVLTEGAVSDAAKLLPLARTAEPFWHWGPWARGAALYRAGEYEKSIACFEAATRKFRPRAWDWCFLAMAQHRLGQTDPARRSLSSAIHWIEAADRRTETDPTETKPAWGDWHEAVVYPLLLQEAEALLDGDKHPHAGD
jgi:tetratricopeptide (TPR) repeat protein